MLSLLARNIRHLRENAGLSQIAFGKLFEASRSMVDSYENDRAEPSPSMLQKIAAHFKLPMDAFLLRDLSKPGAIDAAYSHKSSDASLLQAKDELIKQLRKQVESQQDIIDNLNSTIKRITSKGKANKAG